MLYGVPGDPVRKGRGGVQNRTQFFSIPLTLLCSRHGEPCQNLPSSCSIRPMIKFFSNSQDHRDIAGRYCLNLSGCFIYAANSGYKGVINKYTSVCISGHACYDLHFFFLRKILEICP